MDKEIRTKMETIKSLAAKDPQYRQMLLDMRVIEKRYDAVLAALSEQEQNAICDFVSQCEEMSWRMLELACLRPE